MRFHRGGILRIGQPIILIIFVWNGNKFTWNNSYSIICTVFIDKQNHNVDKQNELEEVLRYDRVLSIFIEQYTLYYRCITTPVSEDMRTDYKLNADFAF